MDSQIDINQDFTMDKLRQLIASRHDNRDRQLRVSHDGIVYMEDNPHHVDLSDTYFAVGIWNEGEGYMGAVAAQDDDHIERVFNAIQANWPKRKAPYKVIDMP